MEYAQIPREVIYKDRSDLNEFGVQIEGTLNNYLFNQMRRMTLLRLGDAKQIALQCLNNAYYICTLTQLDEFPDTCMDKYEEALLQVNIPFKEDVYQASMALVCILLAAYDDKYKQKDDLLIESIHHWTSHKKWMNSLCRKSFDDIEENCHAEGFIISSGEIEPRDIIEVIESADSDTDNILLGYREYICERLALMDDTRKRMYGADLAIAKLKDYLQKMYEDYGYDPKTKTFEEPVYGTFSAESDFESSFWKEVNPIREAIEYYTKHYPSEKVTKPLNQDSLTPSSSETTNLSAENEQLKQQLARTNNRLEESKNTITQQSEHIKAIEAELSKANQMIEEFRQPVEELTGEQKLRMALTLKLLREAGLTEEILNKRGNKQKAASIMSFLLDIKSNNEKGNSAQLCGNFLTDKFYYPRKENKDLIIKLNSLCVDLGLRVNLSLEEKSTA